MKLIVLDIETTGLDPDINSILEIAAARFDTVTLEVMDGFHSFCAIETMFWQAPALEMHRNNGLVKACTEYGRDLSEVIKTFGSWLGPKKATFCGKNVSGFDLRFLELAPGWKDVPHHHRVLDLGSLFFVL